MSDQTTVLHDPFEPEPSAHWTRHLVGSAARLEPTADGVRLILAPVGDERYHDSQLDDFHGRERADFVWRPPLRLSLRARFSHDQTTLQGTSGFGWWNAPFEGDRATQVGVGPQVLWFFFASPPSNLAATDGWSGDGWFAQSLDIPTVPGWLVQLGMWAMRLPPLRWLARRGASGVSRAAEMPLQEIDITEWHDYEIEWRADGAAFYVDGERVLHAPSPPSGPLALVLWIDNQWATIDNEAGLLAIPERQWLELDELTLRAL